MGSPEVGGCHEVLAHVWLYLDQETDPPTCAQVEEHLAVCEQCRRAARFNRRLKQLVRRCADEPVSPDAVRALRVKLEATLRRPPSGPVI